MDDFDNIIDNLKQELEIISDSKIAEELGLTRSSYGERKKRKSIPYENIIILCKNKKISIDLILKNEENLEKKENYQRKLKISINKLDEENCKYFYHLIELELIKNERLK